MKKRLLSILIIACIVLCLLPAAKAEVVGLKRRLYIMKRRILSLLIVLCMVMSLVSVTAFAVENTRENAVAQQDDAKEPAAKTIQFGSGVISTPGNLYFGNCKGINLKWNILDTKTNTGKNGLFLVTNDIIYKSEGDPLPLVYHEDGGTLTYWQDSTSRQWCQKFATVHGTEEYSAFSAIEMEAVLSTTEEVNDTMDTKAFLKDDKVFILSDDEYNNRDYVMNRMVFYRWITRTPGEDLTDIGRGIIKSRVDHAIDKVGLKQEGSIGHGPQNFSETKVRPAMNVDPSNFYIVSPAVGGKQSTASDGNLTAVTDYTGNDWKVTFVDQSRDFSIGEYSAEAMRKNLKPGSALSFYFHGARNGGNEYISAIIADTDDNICYYGRLCKTDDTNLAKVTVPADLATGKYTLKIFNEQYNGDCATDCVSNSVNFEFSVAESIQFGTGRLTGYKYGYDTVYYGEYDGEPVSWRILDTKTNIGGEGFFLLSEKLFGSGNRGQVYFNESDNGNGFQGSDAQKWCQNFANSAFDSAELSELIKTTKSDRGLGGEIISYPGQDNILKDDTVFFLSAEEAENANYGFTDNASRIAMFKNEPGRWWLRSRYILSYDESRYAAGAIGYGGNVGNAGVNLSHAARPAVNMKTDKILFVSAIGSGKADEYADPILTPVTYYGGNEWKLTLFDESRNDFTASLSKTTGITAGETVEVTYSGAKTGDNEYVSAMILDRDGKVIYYGRIDWNNDNSRRSVIVPSDLKNDTYTIRLFSEQYNGDRKTDYAGKFVDIPFTVTEQDTTRPTITSAGAERTSTTTADVYFTANEAGFYYLGVGYSPDYTVGEGTPCSIYWEEVKVTGLKPREATYAFIVVKDRAGNISDMRQILIPADADYSVSLKTGGGVLAEGKNIKKYICGTVTALPTAADITRKGYTFAGWYTDDDFSGNAVTEIGEKEVGNVTFYAKWEACEQFSLADGGTYYFDLSDMNIPGTVNVGNKDGAVSLPDPTLHYVPFTYAGVVYAYKMGEQPATVYTDLAYAKANRYAHSLFVAENNITNLVSWDQLNEKGMIFGTDYISNGITYSLRTPSVGSDGQQDSTVTAAPGYNEWDSILNKNENYIKNWEEIYSWGQDVFQTHGNVITLSISKVLRGLRTPRALSSNAQFSGDAYYVGFRPVLEITKADELGTEGLKAVTLNLNGGKLGDSTADIQIIVKSGNAFTAPASAGLTAPVGYSTADLKWRDDNGNLYTPGDSVPSHIAKLTAQFTLDTYTVTLHANGGTIADKKNVTEYTYGTGALLPTAEDMTYTGHTFIGWYDNEEMTGSRVTAIGNTIAGNKEYWAKWDVNQYTVTVKPENGEADIIIKQDYGTQIVVPVLTRKGYSFNGWDKNFPTTMPDKNITITAQWLDVEAPTGEIKIAENGWKSFFNNITFGLFFKDTQTVTVTAADNSNDTVKIEYLPSDKELTKEALDEMTFTEYSAPFNINPDNEYIIYVKLTDKSGNVAYINTDGIVLDATVPVISGIEDGKTYCAAQTVSVDEKYIDTVTVNGTEVSLDENGQFVLSPANGEQTVIVTDKSGNETEVAVTVNDGHTGGNATCTAQAVCDVCRENYGQKNPNNHSGTENWDKKPTTHEKKWNCCNVVTVSKNSHKWVNGVCSECGYNCRHTYEWQSENGQYWQKCELCGGETDKKTIPEIVINGVDNVCRTQNYKFDFTLPNGATDATYSCEFDGFGDGPVIPTVENGRYSGIIKAGDYPKDKNSFKLIVSAKTVDGFDFFAEKTVAVKNKHTGGTATCNKKAICEICGESYGELDKNNHTDMKHIDEKTATLTDEGNIEYWHCEDCGKYFADKDATKEIAKADTVTAKLPKEKPTETNTASPKTGDANNLALLIALLFIGGGVVSAKTVFCKNKR